jgi:hypothetical protein
MPHPAQIRDAVQDYIERQDRPVRSQCHLAKVDHATSESERRLTSLIVAGPSCRVPWSPGLFTR